MFKIESNIEEVKKSLTANLRNAVKFDKALREGALNAVVLISDRVQQRGLKADETKITSSAKKKYNAYSYNYGKYKRKNHQTEFIDLTFSGDMMGDFIAIPEGENSYIVGFRGKTASDKADWNEAKFGKIFQLSGKESQLIVDIIRKKANAIINKAS